MNSAGNSATDLAYIAGQIDADGSIGIGPHTSTVRGVRYAYAKGWVQLASQDKALLLWAQGLLGGSVTRMSGCYCWQANVRQQESILEALLPYLRTKKAQAELLLTFLKLPRRQGAKLSTLQTEERMSYVLRSRELNKGVSQEFKKVQIDRELEGE